MMDKATKDYIKNRVEELRQSILSSMDDFDIKELLVNPYIAVALMPEIKLFICLALDAHLFKSIQTKFGNIFEDIAIQLCGDNSKTGAEGIDLDLSKNNKRLIVAIKSGDRCYNSQSAKKQKDQFAKYKRTVRQNDDSEVISIVGYAIGNNKTTDHQGHTDYAIYGQSFWKLISGDDNFYLDMIDEMDSGSAEFMHIWQTKKDEVVARLLDDLRLRDNNQSNVNLWRSIAKDHCENLKDNDILLRRLEAQRAL